MEEFEVLLLSPTLPWENPCRLHAETAVELTQLDTDPLSPLTFHSSPSTPAGLGG